MRYSRRQVLRGVLATGALATLPEALLACAASPGTTTATQSAGPAASPAPFATAVNPSALATATGSAESAVDPSALSAAQASAASAAWAEVEAAAQKEKTIAYYTFASDRPLVAMFKADYPWANVNFSFLTHAQAESKFLTEHRAGSNIGDVVVALPSDLPPLVAAKAAASTTVPNDLLTLTDLRDANNYLHPINQVLYVYGFKPSPGLNPPADIFHLADPVWKGKLVFDSPTAGGPAATVLASRRTLWGDTKWRQWLQGLAANNVQLTQSASTTITAVVQGARPVGIDGYQDIALQPAGTRVVAGFYQDPVSVPTCAVINQNAPHPNMARLFVNWLLSPKVQAYYASVGRSPTANIETPFSLDKILPQGFTALSSTQMTNWNTNSQSFIDIYKQYWPAS
jgi:ABC-type Fe3+ transport system substrate-binding protein